MTYVIKSKPDCPFCVKAMELLNATGEQIVEQKHVTTSDITAFKQAGFTTFPQVFENGVLIGGYTDLKDHLAAREEF